MRWQLQGLRLSSSPLFETHDAVKGSFAGAQSRCARVPYSGAEQRREAALRLWISGAQFLSVFILS
jgi:hypothetical protein